MYVEQIYTCVHKPRYIQLTGCIDGTQGVQVYILGVYIYHLIMTSFAELPQLGTFFLYFHQSSVKHR